MTPRMIGFAITSVALLAACNQTPVGLDQATSPTVLAKKGGGGSGGGGTALSLAMTGDLVGSAQAVSGRNDSRTLSAKGEYQLEMRVDLANLTCGDLPGTIPDVPGLVQLVQEATPTTGTLDLSRDKLSSDPSGRVDRWTTTIGNSTYEVQLFGWDSADVIENDGTTVQYRGASIMVFEMKGKRRVSREQCFGSFVDYDVTVQ
jgi:hypothetical protein